RVPVRDDWHLPGRAVQRTVRVMNPGEIKPAALAIGASLYDDKKFAPLPSAAESARAIADKFDSRSIGHVEVTANPGRSDDLFVVISKAIHVARRGAFVLYFSGNVLRRDSELLFAVQDSEVTGTMGCVPLSDI